MSEDRVSSRRFSVWGEHFQACVVRSETSVVEVANALEMGRSKVYEYFKGKCRFPTAWQDMLPFKVRVELCRAEAADLGFDLRPRLALTGVVDDDAQLAELATNLPAPVQIAAASQADGVLSLPEIAVELAKLDEAEASIISRRARLHQALALRGDLVRRKSR